MSKRISCCGPSQTVSVGIVAYNTPICELQQTATSVAASSVGIQIIILCNSSSPEYNEAIQKTFQHTNFKLMLNHENKGFGFAHNEIIAAVNSQWYVCCNPDISVEPESIAKLLDFGSVTPDAVLIMPRIINKNGTLQKVVRRHLTLKNWIERQIERLFPNIIDTYENKFDYYRNQSVEFVSGAFFICRTEKLKILNGFCTDFFLYYEDADLSRRASSLGQNYYVADAVVAHAWGKAWARSPSATFRQVISALKYFRRHGFFSN